MSWLRDDPVVEAKRLLAVQRDERAKAQLELEAATHARDAAMALVDRHNAEIGEARQRARDASAEIDDLLGELHRLIPRPRGPLDPPVSPKET